MYIGPRERPHHEGHPAQGGTALIPEQVPGHTHEGLSTPAAGGQVALGYVRQRAWKHPSRRHGHGKDLADRLSAVCHLWNAGKRVIDM